MATKIRLQRRGRKGYAFYQIIIADSRAPRDGRFIEKIGSYNPNTNPATIVLDFDRALYWLQTGAQPTDTTRNILSDKGVLLKKHLLGGVAKGAFSEEEAERRFQAWLADKEKTLDTVKNQSQSKATADAKARLDAEKAVNKAKAESVAQKRAEANVAEAEATAEVESVEETPAAEVARQVEAEVAETVDATEVKTEEAEAPELSTPEAKPEVIQEEEKPAAEEVSESKVEKAEEILRPDEESMESRG